MEVAEGLLGGLEMVLDEILDHLAAQCDGLAE